MRFCIASLLLAAAAMLLLTTIARGAPVTVSALETWDGVGNPHAGDGVVLAPSGLNSVYTIPNGMTINLSGQIDLDPNVAALAAPDPNNNVTLSFAPGGGGLVLNGAINAHSGIRNFTPGIERTLTLNLNNNNITGTGDIVFLPLVGGSSANRHNISIIGTGSVSFDDINLVHDDGGPGGNVNINVHGSVTLDHINTSDTSGGGGPAENISIRGSAVTIGSISAFAMRGSAPNDNGNVVIEALAPPTFSGANAAGNNIGNAIKITGAVILDGPALGQPGGNLTLRAVKIELPTTFTLNQQTGATRTFEAGVGKLGFPTASLFKHEVNGTTLSAVHNVQWTAPALVLGTSTETFDTAASAALNDWTANNNTASNNNFGFSNTNNTGGTPAGEAGGVFARSGVVGYYADTNLGGSHGRNFAFGASGEFDLTAINNADNSFGIGFFDAAGSTIVGPGNFDRAALVFAENGASTNSVRALAQISLSDGTTLSGTPFILTGLNVDRTFTIDFDPLGGTAGFGQLEVSLSGAGGGTSFVDLVAAQNGKEFDLNSFGLFAVDHVSPDSRSMSAFIDNVTYSSFAPVQAAVPEPSSIAVWLVALCLGGAWVVSKRRPRH